MFEEFKKEDLSLSDFIKWLKKHDITEIDELVFFPDTEPLQFNLAIYHLPTIFSTQDLAELNTNDYHYIARTIDGDHLFASENRVMWLPRSLIKSDVKWSPYGFVTLFKAYIQSNQAIENYFFSNYR